MNITAREVNCEDLLLDIAYKNICRKQSNWRKTFFWKNIVSDVIIGCKDFHWKNVDKDVAFDR